jgi:probable F420-dependent oxidoreductase
LKFSTGLPGLTRFPPKEFLDGAGAWQTRLTSQDYQRIARATEAFGYDAISVPEHFAVPTDFAEAIGSHFPDALTAMAFIAGATEKIRVNSSVIVLPCHEPIVFAKAVATLDVLSGGRVIITVGVGMARGEFTALGVPFERRGKMTDEYVEVLTTLWTASHPEFHGDFASFSDVLFEPKPVQQPHPPIWFGGSSMAALRRAARVGNGWAPSGAQGGKGPWFNTVADLPQFLDEARRVPGFEEREADFDISVRAASPALFNADIKELPTTERPPRSAQELIDRVASMQEAGVTWTSIVRPDSPAYSIDDYLENLEWAATEVMSAFR